MKLTLNKIAAVAACALAIQNATAIPNLQLDSPQGTFDTTTQTTVSTSDTFDLWALGKAPSGTYFLSVAVTPKMGNTPENGASIGSFKIGSTTYSYAAGNLTYGAPPNPVGTHDNLYPTFWTQIAFTFGGDTIPSYDVQTDAAAGGVLSRNVFAVDMAGLNDGFGIHFDLYNLTTDKKGNTIVGDFAPFSHDAEGGGTSVPDGGATAALLGMGVLGLAAFRRKS
jgi:hypothetical protein